MNRVDEGDLQILLLKCFTSPFVTQYNPSVPNLKHILMEKWHLIESQPKLKEMFKEPPIISYKRGISLRDILVRAKL